MTVFYIENEIPLEKTAAINSKDCGISKGHCGEPVASVGDTVLVLRGGTWIFCKLLAASIAHLKGLRIITPEICDSPTLKQK